MHIARQVFAHQDFCAARLLRTKTFAYQVFSYQVLRQVRGARRFALDRGGRNCHIRCAMNIPIRAPEGAPARSVLATEVERRRTFAIISHPDAGKTTLTEKLLLFGGAIQLAGQVKAKRDRRTTRSDWMAIERERGISVVTSVMTFEYDGRVFNLLDTPGHEDFSEDTYRTLTAVDSAVMVIDAAKGIEARTRKLFEVCRLRDIPIVTFINKMDRESRDPFDLIDEIEKTLALDTAPITWPVGRGRDFVGTIDVATGSVRLLDAPAGDQPQVMTVAEVAALNPNLEAATVEGELDLVREACKRFDLTSFREGHLSPVFFGSALKNFGVKRSARCARGHGAGAAGAGCRQAPGDRRRGRHVGLRVQGAGQHGPEPSRPHRFRAAVLRQAQPRHEGEAGAHRQGHQPATRRNSSSPRTARSRRRLMPAMSSAFPITACCASATR